MSLHLMRLTPKEICQKLFKLSIENAAQNCRETQESKDSLKTKKSKIRTHEGWKYQWTTPNYSKQLVKSIIPGPFLNPKLVKPLPYVISSNCKSCPRGNDPLRRLRNGIPDPWHEYLAWKEDKSIAGNSKIALRDVRLSWDYMRIVDYVWSKKGLPMVQGIPDPWRIDKNCVCEKDNEKAYNEQRKNRRSKQRNESSEVKVVVVKPKENVKVKHHLKKSDVPKIDRKHKEKEKKKCEKSTDFDRIKRKLTDFDNELKVKDNEKKMIYELKNAKLKNHKKHEKVRKSSDKVNHPEKSIKVMPQPILRASSNTKVRNEKSPNETIHPTNSILNTCKKKSSTAVKNISNPITTPEMPRKSWTNSKKTALQQDYMKNSFGRSESSELSESVDDAIEFLKEINTRIKITKDALNSPHSQIEKSSMKNQKKEANGSFFIKCDNFDESISDCKEIPDLETRYLECRYRKNRNSVAMKNDVEQIVIESYSERE